MASDTRCPAFHDCEFEWRKQGSCRIQGDFSSIICVSTCPSIYELRAERAELRPERADLSPYTVGYRPDLRPERSDLRSELPWGGERTNK